VSHPFVVVLAAGSGLRLGRGPKAHVAISGKTFLEWIVSSSREAGLLDIVVVSSRGDAAMPRACEALGVRMVVNDEPTRGMSSSVRIGLTAGIALAEMTGALIWPVDVPRVRSATIRLIADKLDQGADVSAHPVYRAASGHPIALGSDVIGELALRLEGPLRHALAQMHVKRIDVPCDDAGVVTDINTPDDLQAAEQR
jgi:CTP:molybdopterin cytidylyltransferase MocA